MQWHAKVGMRMPAVTSTVCWWPIESQKQKPVKKKTKCEVSMTESESRLNNQNICMANVPRLRFILLLALFSSGCECAFASANKCYHTAFFFFVLFCNKKAHTQTTVLRVCLIPVSCIWVAIEILQIARNECENFRIEKQWTWHRFIVLTGSQGKKSREKHRTNNVVELDVCGVCMRRTTPKIGILLRFEHLWTIGQGVNNSFQFTENWDRGGRVAWWW